MSIEIRRTAKKGRAVFATQNFEENEEIELCPIIILHESDTDALLNTKLVDYQFPYRFDDDGNPNDGVRKTVIALGYCSLLNASMDPNAGWYVDPKRELLVVYATKRIKKGSEITMSYEVSPERFKERGFVE